MTEQQAKNIIAYARANGIELPPHLAALEKLYEANENQQPTEAAPKWGDSERMSWDKNFTP